MKKLIQIRRFWANEKGATAIEYALFCGIMSAALIAVAGAGGALDAVYDEVSKIVAAMSGGGGGDEVDGGGG